MTTPLVTTEWLAQHLHDANIRLVDIRGHVAPASTPPPHYFSHRAEYDQSRLPNAVFVDWTKDIVLPGSRSLDIATPAAFAALMGQLGIGDETYVVIYDDADGMFAARLWWALRYYGHEAVSVLDGGWKKWTAEGRVVTTDLPTITPAVFTARPQPSLRVTADDLLHSDDERVLVDVRSLREFQGEDSRAARSGHIPNAIHLPRSALVQADGTMLPVTDLTARFAAAGVALKAPSIVTYCNSGVSASYTLLALAAAGADHVALYDGSWKDWGNNPALPIATS